MNMKDRRKDYAVKAAIIINNEEFLKNVFRKSHSLTDCAELFNLYVVRRLRGDPWSVNIFGMTQISLATFFERVETSVPGIGRVYEHNH